MLVVSKLLVFVAVKHYSHFMLLCLVHKVVFLLENLVQVRVSLLQLEELFFLIAILDHELLDAVIAARL